MTYAEHRHPDVRFKIMDEFGDYCQIILLPAPTIEALGGPDKSPDIAEARERWHGGDLPKASQTLPHLHRVATNEQSRSDAARRPSARRHPGSAVACRSLQTSTAPLSDGPEHVEFFELMAKREIGIWMHPRSAGGEHVQDRKPNPNTKSGGRSAGPTKPAPQWLAWSSGFFDPSPELEAFDRIT